MARKTTAAVLFETGKPLRLVTVSIPPLKPGQVLIDIAYSGLCGSQLLEVEGKRGPDRFLPHTLGHEASGAVLEIGADVKKVKSGDHVVVSWIKGTGADVPSTVYDSPEGPINSGAVGTFMSQTITCENHLTVIPDSFPLREAALLGCAVPTGAGTILNTANVKHGDTVAVIGTGGVGLSAVMMAAAAGAATVIAIDLSDSKLVLAQRLGATHTVNAAEDDPLEAVMAITDSRGVDFAVEAAGRVRTMETAFRAVRANGGLCILAGNLPAGTNISIDPFDLIKGKRIVGTWGGRTNPDRDIPIYADMYLAGKLNFGGLISKTYPLERVNHAVESFRNGATGRILLDMTKDL